MNAKEAIELLDPIAIDRRAHMQRFSKVLKLTARQYEIFLLLGEGFKSRELCKRLFICGATVSTHLLAIINALEMKDSYSLRSYASRFVERMGKPLIIRPTNGRPAQFEIK